MPPSKADLQTAQVDNHRSCFEFKKLAPGRAFFTMVIMKGVLMDIDVEEYISIPEAAQNYDVFSRDVVARDDEADTAASRILAKHIKAFEELAK